MSYSFEHFGEWLRHWRKERGLSQESLGKLAGVSKQHISNIERRQQHHESGAISTPTVELTDKLAKALNRPISEARDMAGYGINELPSNSSSHKVDFSIILDEVMSSMSPLPIIDRVRLLESLTVFYRKELHEYLMSTEDPNDDKFLDELREKFRGKPESERKEIVRKKIEEEQLPKKDEDKNDNADNQRNRRFYR